MKTKAIIASAVDLLLALTIFQLFLRYDYIDPAKTLRLDRLTGRRQEYVPSRYPPGLPGESSAERIRRGKVPAHWEDL